MGFSVSAGVPAATVFLQGILSFFSPCVLPLVPLYMSYLAGGAQTVGEDGVIRYPRGRIMTHTVCFVLGVSSAFFLLGLGFSAPVSYTHLGNGRRLGRNDHAVFKAAPYFQRFTLGFFFLSANIRDDVIDHFRPGFKILACA